jgi:hypothetical protein
VTVSGWPSPDYGYRSRRQLGAAVAFGDGGEGGLGFPGTYNNYFSSREQAIVAAVTAEREARVAAAVAARPATVRLADAVTEAIVEQYTDPGNHDPGTLLLITTCPALHDAFLGTAAEIEHPLATVIAERIGDTGQRTARVLSASVAAAVRIALQQWVQPAAASPAASELVIPSGSLPDLLRASLAPLAPALDAAEQAERAATLPSRLPAEPQRSAGSSSNTWIKPG